MTHKPTEELDRFPRKIWTDKKYPFKFTILGPVSETSIECAQKIESQELLKVAADSIELCIVALEYRHGLAEKYIVTPETLSQAREALAKIKEYFGESENSVTANKNI